MGDTNAARHNGAIDFLKFCFAMMIVVFHGNYIGDFGLTLFAKGSTAVEFFFLASGFLMAKKAYAVSGKPQLQIGSETARFLMRKVAALLPYVLIAYVFSFIGRQIVSGETGAQVVKNFIYSIWDPLMLRMSGVNMYVVNAPAWYISSMLIAMMMLYPFMIKNFDGFTHIAAPLIALFLLGFMGQVYGHFYTPSEWTGFAFKGTLRALAELSLGSVCFIACRKFFSAPVSKKKSRWLAAAEIVCWAGAFGICCVRGHNELGYAALALMSVAITITFGKKSAISGFFDKNIFIFLGKFSLVLFLNHYTVQRFFRFFDFGYGYIKTQILYIAASIVLSVICLLAVDGLKKLWKKIAPAVKGRLIASEGR